MQVRKHAILILLFGIACLFIACKRNHRIVTRSIYYWKTIYKPTGYELQKLKQAGCQRIYIRLCDLDWSYVNKQILPTAPINFQQSIDTAFQYIPVVFITQRAIANTADSSIAQLAAGINNLVKTMGTQAHITPPEVQIDCDWNSTSKDKYFKLLKLLKTKPYIKSRILSCTIRMHQAKYTVHNGIPPADRGLLMCYNMGDIKKPGSRNSILSVDEAKDYLKYINTYPLPLDIALPLFDWCLLFRDNEWKGILRDVAPDNISQSPLFNHTKDNLYTCLADTFYLGYYFKKNDEIRIETSTYGDIKSIAGYTADRVKNADINIIFFDCDSIVLSKFPNHELEAVYNIYN